MPLRMTQAELTAGGIANALAQEAQGQLPLYGWLAAPLVGREGSNLGLLALSEKEEGEFSAEDEAILVQLAQLTAIALENTWLYQQVQQALSTRDELFSLVTHDLKNPLGAIKGLCSTRAQTIDQRTARGSQRHGLITRTH